jgi:hypothetical protein
MCKHLQCSMVLQWQQAVGLTTNSVQCTDELVTPPPYFLTLSSLPVLLLVVLRTGC